MKEKQSKLIIRRYIIVQVVVLA